MIYNDVLEKLMQHFTGERYAEEVKSAREEFMRYVGSFDEEADDLDVRMSQFLDWYLFVRKMDSGSRPVDLVARAAGDLFNESEQEAFKGISSNRHSLFEFLKIKGSDVYLKDLFSGYKMILKSSPVTIGFRREELLEARLFPYEDSFVFGNSFCIHPAEATKFILKEIKTVKKQTKKLPDEEVNQKRQELMFRLFKMRHKINQYKHVKIGEIYTNEPKLKF